MHGVAARTLPSLLKAALPTADSKHDHELLAVVTSTRVSPFPWPSRVPGL